MSIIDVKQFRKSLTYISIAPISKILAGLEEIKEIDRDAEIKQKARSKKIYYSLGGIFGSIILLVILSQLSFLPEVLIGFLGILLILAAPICFVAMMIFIVLYFRIGRLNLDNYRYESTYKILQFLDRDIDKNAEVEVKLSFRKIDSKEYKKNTVPHPQKPGWKIDYLEQDWLMIQGKFLDKTRFTVTLTNLAKKQYGWKTNYRGKRKYKVKTKSSGLDIHLALNYPQNRYAAIKDLENKLLKSIQVPQSAYVKGVKITDKALHLIVRLESQLIDNSQEIYQTILMMFLSCYQSLNLAKKISKSSDNYA
ncbi:MAG TPA: hypothetical protein VK203_19065 [Nostocaceae cyanobacterium]|nr:hypothetical protein [Nostocaceae cyanobacterium]